MSHPDRRPDAPPSGVVIEHVSPELDCGRFPVKREVGDVFVVSADIFADGHGALAAVLRYRRWHDDDWQEAEMRYVDNDRWSAEILLTDNTRYCYTIEAFPDVFATWSDGLVKKHDAGLDVTLELLEGRAILVEAGQRADAEDAATLSDAIAVIDTAAPQATIVRRLLGDDLREAMRRCRSRAGGAVYGPELSVVVDRVRARYAAWYEFVPRSAGTDPTRSATFAEAAERLPAIAELGFDVVYLPPIHPIGRTFRKGPNNTLEAGPRDPGVPYAIGGPEGGHDAIEPGLGTLDDFRAFVARAETLGMEVALDFAVQASPDHPWVSAHPTWFTVRPDGSIQYAENPPKKYQDIYPIDFQSVEWRTLWEELKRIVLFWVEQGVKTFRVDNPHTKPLAFWEWLIAEVQRAHPETIFLAEAFTRPKVMKALAKAGFTQSYTYFTWRNFKQELIEYFTELTQSEMVEYFRGNLFTNTPDILPVILQEGGRPAFRIRLALAATLSSVYGIYSGFELCENTPIPGREEYLGSEKYAIVVRDWNAPGNILEDVARINRIRRDHLALHEYANLRFFGSEDDNILCYGKTTADLSDIIVVVVNLDP
ncbi:MAG: alpha-1,4-glucan--maltose-1-phosphate maltosyltransferase, partial [Thermomicrobiales bacterium]|nr:alpha-1,4-glucan--maltose-1-phosphate maltosyltransferase [Thermomicrobiales bacterium]